MTVKYVQGADTTIYGSGANAGATSLVLTSLVDRNSVALTMSDFGTIGFATIEQGVNGKEEGIQFTGITQNSDGTATLTGVSNVLLKQPYTASSGLSKSHAGGVSVVFSNTAGFYNTFANKQNAETIEAVYSFTALPNVNLDPVSGNDLARRSWVLSVVNGGAVSTNQVIVAGTAGETISAGNLIYFDTTEKEWMQCDADVSAKVERVLMGIAQGAGTNGNPISGGILLSGVDTNQSGLTAGAPVYASNTPGLIASSAGTISKVVGMAVAGSTTSVYFDQYFSLIPTSSWPSTFVSTSAGAADAGKGVLTDAQGKLGYTLGIKYGGDGSDGALSISSGATNIDLSGARVLVKNYSSISITGTGSLTFTNPNTNGTIIILRCSGNVTLTSSATPMIDASGLGSAGGAGVNRSTVGTSDGNNASDGYGISLNRTGGGKAGINTPPSGIAGVGVYPHTAYNTGAFSYPVINALYPMIFVGAGGGSGDLTINGSGNGTSGTGGRGGGALIIECAGLLNFTTTNGISVAGKNGSNGTITSGSVAVSGGSGGGGGYFYMSYNLLTASSGTVNVAGGIGGNYFESFNDSGHTGGGGGGGYTNGTDGIATGTNNTKNGGDGGVGFSLIEQNKYI